MNGSGSTQTDGGDKECHIESGETKQLKRNRSDAFEALDADITSEDMSKMSRSERKRHREKKRRSDVNKGCEELRAILVEIDPTVRAEAEERARKGTGTWKNQNGAQEDNLLSRVELISRACNVLRNVHNENKELRKLMGLQVQGGSMPASTPITTLPQHVGTGSELIPGHFGGLGFAGVQPQSSPNVPGTGAVLSSMESMQRAALHEAAIRDTQNALNLRHAVMAAKAGAPANDPLGRVAALRSATDASLAGSILQGQQLSLGMTAALGFDHNPYLHHASMGPPSAQDLFHHSQEQARLSSAAVELSVQSQSNGSSEGAKHSKNQKSR